MIVRHVIKRRSKLVLGLICSYLFLVAETNAYTSGKAIKSAITSTVLSQLEDHGIGARNNNGESVSILISDIDSQLNFKDCDKQLTVSGFKPASKNQRQAVKVSCNTPKWSLYVPVTITLPTKQLLTRALVLEKSNQQLSAYLEKLGQTESLNIAEHQLVINENLLNPKTFPKPCSDYIETQLETKHLKPGNLSVSANCIGTPSWKVRVPLTLTFIPARGFNSDDIKQQVNGFIEEALTANPTILETVSRTDYELKKFPPQFKTCYGDIKFELTNQKITLGRNTLTASCRLFGKWRQIMIVMVHGYKNILYSKRHIIRGELIQPADITIREIHIEKSNAHQILLAPQVLGLKAKLSIPANQPILDTQLAKRILVYRGDEVILSAKTGGIVVRIPGQALTDGIFGQQIRVENKQSKKIVFGKVVAPGQIEVIL